MPLRTLLRTFIAGWGARRLGGGCITTVIVFVILYFLLSQVF